MSSKYEGEVTCQQCGADSQFVFWQSINTVLNPELKEAVRDCSVFRFKCPECGAEVIMDYSVLYHQMEDNLMIYYVQEERAEEAEKLLSGNHGFFGEVGLEENDVRSLKRVVTSQNHLLEKLAIFDAGLDDRIIEVIKALFAAQYYCDNEDADLTDILFHRDEQGQDKALFFKDGECIAKADITKELYDGMVRRVASDWPDMRDDAALIDYEWAMEVIRAV